MSNAINAVAGFEAILTHNALITPQVNKLKAAGTPPEYYALIAFPAEAQAGLWDVLVECAQARHNMSTGFSHGIKTNKSSDKPIVGVADDAIMVRAASQYAPQIYDADGSILETTNPAHVEIIKRKFAPGSHVRCVVSPFAWEFKGKRGVSLNLSGIMAVAGEFPRLNIGGPDVAGAFAAHAKPGTGGTAQGGQSNGAAQQNAAAQQSGNPFQQQASGVGAQSANPFA